MAEKNAFMFFCSQMTESECLQKQLVGTTQESAIWTMGITKNDDIYLFNYDTRILRGPYSAASAVDCYDALAWRGRFPVQVRIVKTARTRKADGHATDAPSILSRRLPPHNLGTAAVQLIAWLQKSGEVLD